MDLERFRYYAAWHDHANRREYDAPADPREPIRVDPRAVTAINNELRLNWGLGRVQGGDWDADEHCHALAETAVYRGLVQRFEEGLPWEETAIYERAESAFEGGGSLRGYDSLAAFRRERCAYLDDLFERIDREGYRPNAEATHDNPAADENRYEDAYVHHLEPLVVIGRNGELLWTEGYHRLVIAAILGVDAIPVQVLARHVEWQRSREAVHAAPAGRLPDDLERHADHPDLRDLLA